jgi:hypothetical protein
MRKSLITLLAATAAVTTLPATAHAAPKETRVGTVRQLVADLPVADEQRDGYVRTAFKH